VVEPIAAAVSTPSRSPRQYMPPWHFCVRGDRIEQRFRGAKATGLANLPFDRFHRNSVWVELVLLALSLVGWTQMLLLDGELRVAEPKTLRYRLWHQAARVARHAAAWSCGCNAPGQGGRAGRGVHPPALVVANPAEPSNLIMLSVWAVQARGRHARIFHIQDPRRSAPHARCRPGIVDPGQVGTSGSRVFDRLLAVLRAPPASRENGLVPHQERFALLQLYSPS
jgi:hypothetical protein